MTSARQWADSRQAWVLRAESPRREDGSHWRGSHSTESYCTSRSSPAVPVACWRAETFTQPGPVGGRAPGGRRLCPGVSAAAAHHFPAGCQAARPRESLGKRERERERERERDRDRERERQRERETEKREREREVRLQYLINHVGRPWRRGSPVTGLAYPMWAGLKCDTVTG